MVLVYYNHIIINILVYINHIIIIFWSQKKYNPYYKIIFLF